MFPMRPVTVFDSLLEAEKSNEARLANEIKEMGSQNAKLLTLKKRWHAEAEKSLSTLDCVREPLADLIATPQKHLSIAKNLSSSMDSEWLLTQLAQRLVKDGTVPPPWDDGDRLPSTDHIFLFMYHPSPNYTPAVRDKLLNVFDQATWDKLRRCDTDCRSALGRRFPSAVNGRYQIMCIEGHSAALMRKVAMFAQLPLEVVPYSSEPPKKKPSTVSSVRLDEAAGLAAKAAAEVRKFEDEIVALVLKNPAKSSRIKETERLRAQAKTTQELANRHVVKLCWEAASAHAYVAPDSSRSFSETQFLLTQMALELEEVITPGADDLARSPTFDSVLQFLHSTDSHPNVVKQRNKVRAPFTTQEWKALAEINKACFNHLFNRPPEVVDGCPQITTRLPSSIVSRIAKVVDMDIASDFLPGSPKRYYTTA